MSITCTARSVVRNGELGPVIMQRLYPDNLTLKQALERFETLIVAEKLNWSEEIHTQASYNNVLLVPPDLSGYTACGLANEVYQTPQAKHIYNRELYNDGP